MSPEQAAGPVVRLDVRVDPGAPPHNYLAALARLLRRMRDRERVKPAEGETAPPRPPRHV